MKCKLACQLFWFYIVWAVVLFFVLGRWASLNNCDLSPGPLLAPMRSPSIALTDRSDKNVAEESSNEFCKV